MCTNNNTANMEHQMLGLAKLDANGNTLIPDICVWGGVSVLANNVFFDIRHVYVWRVARMVWMKEYQKKITSRSVAPTMLLTKYYSQKGKERPTYYSYKTREGSLDWSRLALELTHKTRYWRKNRRDFKKKKKTQGDTLRKIEYAGLWNRKHSMAVCGEGALEEAMDGLQIETM